MPATFFSDGEGGGHIVLLPVPNKRAAVGVAADTFLHLVPSVELQTRVRGLHASCH